MPDNPSTLDSLIQSRDGYGCEEVTPRGYVSLMDLYENNFIRFRKLVSCLDAIENEAYSHVPGCMDVHISILERSRYTTTLCMTYHFKEGDKPITEPDLRLRVYHDASLVEVVAGHLKHGRQRLDHLPATALKHKWRLNRFLYRWLGYCLYLGHGFNLSSGISAAEKTQTV